MRWTIVTCYTVYIMYVLHCMHYALYYTHYHITLMYYALHCITLYALCITLYTLPHYTYVLCIILYVLHCIILYVLYCMIMLYVLHYALYCDLVFRFKRKAECNLRDNNLTMKRMGAVESDSVKSAGKLKISCTRPVKERQKLVSELCMGRNKTMRMASMRVTRQWSISCQHISTITCTGVPRVWHFSAFYTVCITLYALYYTGCINTKFHKL